MRRLLLAVCAAGATLGLLLPEAFADTDTSPAPPRWNGPFGGEFHAFVTLTTDYAKSGISSTQNQPAFQVGIDWQSPYLLANGAPLRLWDPLESTCRHASLSIL